MRIAKRAYSNFSICECGYPALRESVPLGKVYEVDEDSIVGGF